MEYKDHRGLSPSSLALFMGCNRKYYAKKIAKWPVDTDASEDYEAFNVGKSFHKVLEDSRHELEGLKFSTVADAVKEFNLDPETHGPMVFAMLGSYKKMHSRAGLKAIACEVIVETESFYGIVDVILDDEKGFWLGDMKTAGRYSPDMLIPTLPSHPQLNLYAAHYKEIAEKLGLDPDSFLGCRYRMTTKTTKARKKDEALGDYIKRLTGEVKSIDFILPKEVLRPGPISLVHSLATKHLAEFKDEASYPPNFDNCMAYFRPCSFWSRCRGKNFTELKTISMVTSEGEE